MQGKYLAGAAWVLFVGSMVHSLHAQTPDARAAPIYAALRKNSALRDENRGFFQFTREPSVENRSAHSLPSAGAQILAGP